MSSKKGSKSQRAHVVRKAFCDAVSVFDYLDCMLGDCTVIELYNLFDKLSHNRAFIFTEFREQLAASVDTVKMVIGVLGKMDIDVGERDQCKYVVDYMRHCVDSRAAFVGFMRFVDK